MHTELELPGVFIFTYPRNVDSRGYFQRVYDEAELNTLGLNRAWPQHSFSSNNRAGTIRGLHYQLIPSSEDKFVRCISGAIYEVLIDLRPTSSHYLEWISFNLLAEDSKGLYIPGGVAHGFQTLQDKTTVSYLNSIIYDPLGQSGINPVHSTIDFGWPLEVTDISDRDLALPRL